MKRKDRFYIEDIWTHDGIVSRVTAFPVSDDPYCTIQREITAYEARKLIFDEAWLHDRDTRLLLEKAA